ncbi:hypothetical protein N8I77_001279 [Diaporthe amygdali]|uniref:Aminoglycoside phosphotransferase domain-containing protein n=1 Tax=Phomopsis amygdali TaxID=1214568 RepID=A0AAD9SQM1_PHOAM|nr:hypothetical protein N8I77_001279 [Diaporthe amygdali]
MGTPAMYLPPVLSDGTIQALLSSLSLPAAKVISPLTATAAYHSIYLLNFPPECTSSLEPAEVREPDGSVTLVLRVSGKHLPRIKTINEVSVMRWVKENTKIPVPAVVRFDASEDNPLGHEFTLLERAPGISVDKVYDQLDTATKHSLISQLAEFLAQIHAHSFDLIGGMQLSHQDGAIVPGPVLDETFWQAPDVAKYWPPEDSVSTLNISGPFESYTALCAAQMERLIYAIEKHGSLAWIRDLVPRLRTFVDLLTKEQEKVRDMKFNDAKIVLAHKDLHFANIMFDPLTGEITGILDWEFAGTVPAPRWNPVRAFLWKGQFTDEAKAEKEALMIVFERMCKERGITVLEDAEANSHQMAMQDVLRYTRAIVEVCPRDEKQDMVVVWREAVEEGLSKFKI